MRERNNSKMKVKLTTQERFQQVINFFGGQRIMAEKLGVTQQFISKVVTGKSDLPLVIAMRIENITEKRFKATTLISEELKCYLKNT